MKERSSNFELLRIVSMVMIVFYHFGRYSGFSFTDMTGNFVYICFLELWGKVGVDLFVFISGYFLINKNDWSVSKTAKLWLQIFFYSIGIAFIYCAFIKNDELGFSSFIYDFLPITTERWWFASTYFVLILIYPFINKLLKALTKKQYIFMLILMVVLWSVCGINAHWKFQGSNLATFVMLYSFAGFIKLHMDDVEIDKKKAGIALIVAVLLALSVELAIFKIGSYNEHTLYYVRNFCSETSLFTLSISLLIFLLFKNMRMKTSKVVNVFASATFGVYLIHENEHIRLLLWKVLLHGKDLQNSPYLIPYSIAACLGVYAVFTLIELARIYILEKNYMKLIYKAEPKIIGAVKKILAPLYRALQ
ncbi:MAG: acyltransferase family protein [Acutalibacteraceae bacterium]